MVAEFLKTHSIDFVQNKSVDTKVGAYRPDFVLDCGTHCHIIEVDDQQHSYESQDCELLRVHTLFLSTKMPTVFTRFNPDEFSINGMPQIVGLEDRLQALLDQINLVKSVIPSRPITIEYMFYDTVDNRVTIEKKIEQDIFKTMFSECYNQTSPCVLKRKDITGAFEDSVPLKRQKTLEAAKRIDEDAEKCSIPECNSIVKAGGLCRYHASGRCSHPGCLEHIADGENGKCKDHRERKVCNVPDCVNFALMSQKVCSVHRKRHMCSIKDCTFQVKKNKLCNKHLKEYLANIDKL